MGMNMPPAKRGQPTGMARDLGLMKDDLAKTVLGLRQSLSAATGHPPTTSKLNPRQTLDRINTYDDPSKAEELKGLSDGDLVKLTTEAIMVRQKAMAKGEWQPKNAPISPPMPTLPAGPSPSTSPSLPPPLPPSPSSFAPPTSPVGPVSS